MYVNLDKYGNTSAASVPIALAEAVNEGRVKVGDNIVMVAFGAGFTSGAVTVEWTADPARGRAGDAAVDPTTSMSACRSTGIRSTRSRRPSPSSWPSRPGGRAARRRRPGRARARAQLPEVRSMIDLTGKSALVTGGSRGHRPGHRPAPRPPGCRRRIQLQGQRGGGQGRPPPRSRRSGRRRSPIQADVTIPSRPRRVVKAALEAFGKVDILVNNAGVTRDDLIMRMSAEAWREVLETNLFGAFWMTKAVTRPMLKARGRPDHQHHLGVRSGRPDGPGQLLRRRRPGLIGLTKATARELASRGITVNAVAPGFVLTELTKDLPEALQTELIARTPLGRFGTTEEIADAVAFLVSDEARYITGQVLAVDGGLVMM